jgi:hypothetical protein
MTFKKAIKNKSDRKSLSVETAYYTSIKNVPADEWNKAINTNDVFVTIPYLTSLEQSKTAGMAYRYVIIKNKKHAIGAMCFQLLNVAEKDLGGLLNLEEKGWLLKKLNKHINGLLFSSNNNRPNYIVSCGSFLVSGEHGISFSDKENEYVIVSILPEIMNTLKKEIEKTADICAWTVKDFFNISFSDHVLTGNKFMNMPMDPEMIFNPRSEWKHFDDYINSLSAKYRLRANNVLKKMNGIVVKELSEKEIQQYAHDIEALYNNVQQRATVRLVRVNASYFIQLKKHLRDAFYIKAFFKEGKMIAFISGLVHKGFHEAHFIGIDYAYNKALQLYQNILYQFIKDAIEKKSCCLYFGRTAMEIKSTVGAKAFPLHTYFKLDNSFLNKMLFHFSKRMKAEEWIERSPFKV